MDIQFVTDEPLDSAWVRYRCLNLQEQLAAQGITSSLSQLGQINRLVLTGDVLVLYRVRLRERTQHLVEAARAAGLAVVYATDDLMFAPDAYVKAFLDHTGRSHSEPPPPGVSVWDYCRNYLDSRRQAMLLCDGVVVSTEYLAARVRAVGKPAFIIRNGLAEEMEASARAVLRDRSLTGGRVMVGYLSGTATHDQDFGEIEGILRRVLRRHRHVYFTAVGPVDLPTGWRRFGSRVRRLPLVPWRDLPSLIAELDINLAPLDMLQSFNHAKSEVKWLEAGAVGVATLASATAGFREAVRHGDTGLLANTPEDWERFLEELVTQPELRARLGMAARREVEQKYTLKAYAPTTAAVFTEIAHAYARHPAGGAGAPPRPREISFPPARPPLGLIARVRRVAGQTGRNVKRLLNPFFWERVLRRWEGRGD